MNGPQEEHVLLEEIKLCIQRAARGERAQNMMAFLVGPPTNEIVIVSVSAFYCSPEFISLLNNMQGVKTLNATPIPEPSKRN